MRTVRRAVLDFAPDVVHAQDRRSGLLCVGLGRRSMTGRHNPAHTSPTVVHTYHGLPEDVTQDWLLHASAPRPSWYTRATLLADARVARNLDATVVPSTVTGSFLIDRLGVPRDRVHHIDNGLLLPAASPPRSLRALVFVGMLIERKGVEDLISAIDLTRSELPELHLDIVGDGPLRAALTEQVLRADLGDAVTFHGFRQDVPQILAAADVMVLPSRMEQQPLVLIEAMASGKLILATDVCGVPDMLRDAGPGAIVVPARSPRALADGLTQLAKLTDPTSLGFSIASIAHKRFSVETSARRHLALYDRLQSSPSTSDPSPLAFRQDRPSQSR
jgi:glycosyltransferase involved in cell wall biosynthesis